MILLLYFSEVLGLERDGQTRSGKVHKLLAMQLPYTMLWQQRVFKLMVFPGLD